MNSTKPLARRDALPSPSDGPEDWEDWEEDGQTSPIGSDKGRLLVPSATAQGTSRLKIAPPGYSEARQGAVRNSVHKPKRLFSRGRQKAQNAKAGIKLVTDMSKFRKQQHIAYQLRSAAEADSRTGKFVDAAALRALEGTPTSASVGSFSWLRRKQAFAGEVNSPHQPHSGLSPADRPIMIGIALPEDDAAARVISPQTAIIETPLDLRRHFPASQPNASKTPEAQEPHSVWSPDTDDGSSLPASRVASSVYSQPGRPSSQSDVPPVPMLPSAYANPSHRGDHRVEEDDDDAFTPVTLFEEDGSPVETRKRAKSVRSKGHTRSPATIATLSGWWDHVQTPFKETHSPLTPKPKSEATDDGKSTAGWWTRTNEKQHVSPVAMNQNTPSVASVGGNIQTEHTSAMPLAIASSSRAPPVSPVQGSGSQQTQPSQAGKVHHLVLDEDIPTEQPPPYEPPSKQVHYRAVFPPGHPLRARFPASPGPSSPGLANTMTSQGAISMTDVPLTPAANRSNPSLPAEQRLPDRAIGTFVPTEHFLSSVGNSPAAKVERQRRRHEKEDFVARKFEGFWKGRGYLPQSGCYGRRGREGRKRRRVCLGILAGFLAAIILIVVLAVTLTRNKKPQASPYSPFLNLTNFPPIPTGVLSVVGTASDGMSDCVQPATLWSCALPKEQQEKNKPFSANQPSFVIQIQFDNNTRQLWDVPDGPIPTPVTKVSSQIMSSKLKTSLANGQNQGSTRRGAASILQYLRRRRRERRQAQMIDPGFTPSPAPPSFQEMYFLGNTSDNIVSSRKAGEPTPFYITFLHSINETAGPNVLSRRGIGNGIEVGANGNITTVLDPVEKNPDGTGVPAKMLTFPVQQPLRLFDRGLPTEHYGFYNFFDKTVYLKSITPLTNGTSRSGDVPTDEKGGSLETEAKFFVLWAQTRFHVQIWTRTDNTTSLLGSRIDASGNAVPISNSTQPGTFPYPITIGEDLHGGNHDKKGTLAYPVDDRQKIVETDPKTVLVDYGFLGTSVNHEADPSWGGIDGGTGGCRCAWTNFRKTRPV
ncbi:uncharacterized protein E0L32_000665 [Thyridium curvatum]|uniref:Glycoprotease family protein n=1 Tax=Thyridium curvatum TaxID=1093900 RepID=A0A507BB71_9PEZI|nr:uncharacterized protein E0L32_000665 [Thyridium curvatum]TPX14271.1 hypothetical protein E0L32_000665 [Thyridium curvatum]